MVNERWKRLQEKARQQAGPLQTLGTSGEAEYWIDHKARGWAERQTAKLSKVLERLNKKPTEKQQSYREYLKSPAWFRKAQEAKKKANNTCQLCGKRTVWLDVHHLTYERLGHEIPTDLIAVCRACHDEVHNGSPDKRNEKPWTRPVRIR